MLRSLRLWAAFKGGRMLLRKGQWRAASFLLRRATALVPDDWESRNNLAIALLKLGRWEEAAGMAQRAIRLAPSAADAHDSFGIALLQMERWEEAVAAYRRAVNVDPARYDSYDRLGMALWRLERWDDVVETYEKALMLDAGRHGAHHRLGVALQRLGRWDAAAAEFRRAIELAVNDRAAAGERAGLELNLAHVEAQIEALKKPGTPIPLHPQTQAHLLRGVELLVFQKWSEAVAELAKGSALTPALGGLHFLRVDPLVRLGRFREAAAAHRQALAAGGDMPGLPGQSAAERFAQRQAVFWTADILGAEVFTAERWLEQLSVVSDHVTPGPRLLFVLDNDFGELTTAEYFLLGQQELAHRATLLLPERLYVHNGHAIPGRTHRYASVDDILGMVDREQPEIVFLCSGYLLWEHLGFSSEDLGRLVDQLRTRGCRVVTADPYLGLLSQQDPRTLISIEIPSEHSIFAIDQLAKAKRSAEERMWTGFAESEQILRDTYHLYPAYGDVSEGDGAESDARNLAFFNDRLIRPTQSASGPDTKPHWLFILGSADCDIQAMFEGDAFLDVVASKLLETLAAGRHPILIAPRDFLDRLMPRMPTAEGIDVLAYCPFMRFMSLLLSAEHAFYWNVVSHSVLIRLYNGLPVVQFDPGHLLRVAPAIHDRIVGWYYQGFEPPIHDHREPLTLETVEEWTADYRRQAARLVEGYRRAMSPAEMIADLMRRPVAPKLEGSMSGGEVA